MSGGVAARKPILLVEPSSMVGGIVVSTARELQMPVVRQATSVRIGHQQLSSNDFSCAIVSLAGEAADGDPAMALLHDVRAHRYRVAVDLPLAVITPRVDEALDVRRVLLQPFKVRELIATMELLSA